MTRIGRGIALALVLCAATPVAAWAQQSAEQVLLDKANYWRLKDRPDLAAAALTQLLQLDPNNPDALFQAGELAVQQNKPADARRYLARLQQVAPDSPHIADLQSAIAAGKIGPTDLSEARKLAQSGQLEEAVKQYQEVFKGPPPSGYGVEYYMTLAGTPQGWDEARQGMEKLAQQSPDDPQVKLALAKIYTYREATRMQGIGMLVQLSGNPVVGTDAVQAWREALTWLGGSPNAKSAMEQYLGRYPQDSEIQNLYADLKNAPATAAQSQAYADLKAGNVAAAERQFDADLHANPNDAQALAGLGLIRMRQQRFSEARDLLARARKIDPGQPEIDQAYDGALFWSRVAEAKHADAAGDYAAARGILAPLLARPRAEQWGAQLVLGDVETKLHQSEAAEATYRQVLRERPGNPEATLGLANALRAQGKTAELAELTARMSPAERARIESSGTGGPAEKLRNEAKQALANGDNATAAAKFQAAMAAAPRDPWIRLDYARFLAGQGQMAQANAAVDPAVTGNTPTSVLVAAMFDVQQDRWVQALDRINSIPADQRDQEIRNFHDRVYVRGTIERAKQLAAAGNTAEARNLLVALYEDPSVTTDEKREAPFVLVKTLHDMPSALQVTHDVYVKGGPQSVKAGADYAMLLLLEGGHDADAGAVLAQVNASGQVNTSNREDLTPVTITLAVHRADQMRLKGDYSGAWAQVSQLLADNPDDTNLLLAAGRIAASSGHSHDAMQYFDKAYQQDSENIDVIRGVVQGSILAHQLGQAQTYLDKAMAGDPQNPWLFFLKAQIAQARGNNGEAIRALEQARALDRQQKSGEAALQTPPANAPAAAPVPLAPAGQPPAAQPAAPAAPSRSSGLLEPTDSATITLAAADQAAAAARRVRAEFILGDL